jgi:hypothetical protein
MYNPPSLSSIPPNPVPPGVQPLSAPRHNAPPPDLLHRLTTEASTARWQAEALGSEVARLTHELAEARNLVEEEMKARERVEEELRAMKEGRAR